MKFKRLKENKQEIKTSADIVVDEKDKTIEQSIEDERETNRKVLKDVMKETTPKDLPLKGPKSEIIKENYSIKLEGYNYKKDDKDNFTVSCKDRAQLAKLIENLKKNNIKHRISKSMNEGYRYDVSFKNKLLKEEIKRVPTVHDIKFNDDKSKIIIDGNEYEFLDSNDTYYLFKDENGTQQEIRRDGKFETDEDNDWVFDESLKENNDCTLSYKYEVHAVDDKDEDKVYKEFKDEQKAVKYAKNSGIKCFIDKVTYCDDEYSEADTIYGPADLEEKCNLKESKEQDIIDTCIKRYEDENLDDEDVRNNIVLDIIEELYPDVEAYSEDWDNVYSIYEEKVNCILDGKCESCKNKSLKEDYKTSDLTNIEVLKTKEYKDKNGENHIYSLVKYIPYGALQRGEEDYLFGVIRDYNNEDIWTGGAYVDVNEDSAKEMLYKFIIMDQTDYKGYMAMPQKKIDKQIKKLNKESLGESYHYGSLEIERDGEDDNEYIIIEGTREGYSISQVEGDTMTVGELIDYLRDSFDDETKILIGNDWQRGRFYTYGSINSGSIYHTDIIDVNDDEEDDEDLEKESLKENKKKSNIEYFNESITEEDNNKKKQPKAHWNDNPEKSAKNIADGTNYNQEAETCTESFFDDEMAEIKKDRPNFCQCFEFENGEVLYVNYDEDTNELYAGHLTNDGVSKDFVIDYDSDFELQPNLEELYSSIIEKHPEYLDSEVTEDFSDDIEVKIEEVPTEDSKVNVEDDDFDLDFDDSVYIDDEESEDEIPSDFDGQMDYLANDEEEAIDGYKQVIDKVEDEHVVDELKKIETEEKAHKDFLNKVKTDKEATYEEPLPQEDEEEVVVDVVDEEGKTVDFKESLSGLKKIKFVDSNNQSNVNNNLEEFLNEEIVVDENVDDEPFSL